MPNSCPDDTKNHIIAIAKKYGIEVVGFLRLTPDSRIPAGEIDLLRGVGWADREIDTSGVQDPLEIMPSARTLVILGKRLMDDRRDVYYRVSEEYMASPEMMVLDTASYGIVASLENDGYGGRQYTSYYVKAWAVLAGLGWIGTSRMFISKEHGPRLRLKGILTDADLGEPCEILGDDRCGECMECMRACPVGAIARAEIDRKKCAACPANHRRIAENVYAYCTACTASCPVGAGRKAAPQVHAGQAIPGQRITP